MRALTEVRYKAKQHYWGFKSWLLKGGTVHVGSTVRVKRKLAHTELKQIQ